MKKILISIIVVLLSAPAFAQCSFKAANNVKPRHDQYSQSSQANIDKSKKAMASTDNDFDKKKYQAVVKNPQGAADRRKTVMRFR